MKAPSGITGGMPTTLGSRSLLLALLFSLLVFAGCNLEDEAFEKNDRVNISDLYFVDYNLQACIEASGAYITLEVIALDCSYYGITDLTGIGNFDFLEFLQLTGNYVTDLSPLSGMSTITFLDLEDNGLTSVGTLGTLTGLRSLNLLNNNITSIFGLEELTSLKALNLHNNILTDISPLAAMTVLTSLNLSDNINLVTHDSLAYLTSLTTLDISYTSVDALEIVATLTTLERLFLEATLITDTSSLSALTNLIILDLSNNPLLTAGVDSLVTLINATTIDLTGSTTINCTELSILQAALDTTENTVVAPPSSC